MKTEGSHIEDQPGSDHGPSREPSPRRQMAVQYNIETVQEDDRRQHQRDLLQDRIRLRLVFPVRLPGIFDLFLIFLQQYNDTGGCNEQHTGLPKGIKAPVTQDHIGDHIDRTELFHSLLHIPGRYFVVVGPFRIPQHRQPGDGQEQHGDQKQTQAHRRQIVQNPECPHLLIPAHILHILLHLLPVKPVGIVDGISHKIRLPQRLHLHLPRKGICFPVHPSGQTAPKTVLIIISDPAHPDLLLLLKALSACAV